MSNKPNHGHGSDRGPATIPSRPSVEMEFSGKVSQGIPSWLAIAIAVMALAIGWLGHFAVSAGDTSDVQAKVDQLERRLAETNSELAGTRHRAAEAWGAMNAMVGQSATWNSFIQRTDAFNQRFGRHWDDFLDAWEQRFGAVPGARLEK